jgi:hypothetical protein
MGIARFILRLAKPTAKRSTFALAVGLVVGVTAFSSGALQLLGGLRAGQAESSENAPSEESERIHVAVLQSRHAKTKGSLLSHHQSVAQTADIHHSICRALADGRCRISPIASWSAAMRC